MKGMQGLRAEWRTRSALKPLIRRAISYMVGVGGLSETLDRYPPKAEVTGSNPVGRATQINGLAEICLLRRCLGKQ
jgi:hypothetical protein